MSAVLALPPQELVSQIRSRVPWDAYAALPGCSITRIKELRRSPLHYRHRLLNPKQSPSLTLGRADHCAVLEPERYDTDHAVWSRRTSSGKLAPRSGKYWDAFKAENGSREILTADQHAMAMTLQAAVRSNPDAMRYLASGDPEVTLEWPLLGRQCKGRVDWFTDIDGPVTVGLKTARDCRPFQFGNQAARLGYHLQWAYYADGYKVITGVMPRVVEIVVEAEPPHAVGVYRVPDDILQQGFDDYMRLLELLAECERDGHWPGPVVGEQELTLPSWVYGETEDDLTDLGLEA